MVGGKPFRETVLEAAQKAAVIIAVGSCATDGAGIPGACAVGAVGVRELLQANNIVKPVINLPGPPPAAFNVAEWCLNAVIAHFLKQPVITRRKVKAVLTETLDTPAHMAFTLRLYLTKNSDVTYLAKPIQMGCDSVVRMMAADAIFISPIGYDKFEKGAEIEVELLRNIEDI
jgi:molybdopterin biosynthesis enzyme